MCEYDDPLDYNMRLGRHMEALVNLRELHVGKSSYEDPQSYQLLPHFLNPPGLTRLVLNEYVLLASFAQLTHLATLRTLSMNFRVQEAFGPHPQDLASLAALSALRFVNLSNWHVRRRQDVSQLTQLTELRLISCTGLTRGLRPTAPMPNIMKLALIESPKCTNNSVYGQDSDFTLWALRDAPKCFPNAEAMHLGTLNYNPDLVRGRSEFIERADLVDNYVKPFLVATPRVQDLRLDLFFDETLDDAFQRPSFPSHNLAVEMDGSGQLGVWKRSVSWTDKCNWDEEFLDIAEWHYCLKEKADGRAYRELLSLLMRMVGNELHVEEVAESETSPSLFQA